MSIEVLDNLFVLQTRHTTYALRISENGQLEHLYWGAKITRAADFIGCEVVESHGDTPVEISSFGTLHFMETAVKPLFADGVRDFRYRAAGHSIDGDTLRIDLRDEHYAFGVSLFYRVHEAHGVIERWQIAENFGRDQVILERFYSAQLTLPGDGFSTLHSRGNWGAEHRMHSEPIQSGKKVFESLRGISGHVEPPTFILHRDADEWQGEVYYGALSYSGNFKVAAETVPDSYTQVLIGVSDSDFAWPLAQGETFETPHVFCGYSDGGFSVMSNRMAAFVREALLPKAFAAKPLPILYNSWYATFMDVDVGHQKALANRAAALGVELFEVDDGWFGSRKNDRAGLGDWWVDPQKFPNGMNELIDHVHGLGMQFGLWIEPEMVNPDSDLYRAHPDWILRDATREPLQGRSQYMLDFSRDEVVDYMTAQIDKLLAENRIDYIKWDYNRTLGECANLQGDAASFKQIPVKLVRGFYRMAETLRANHPRVEFEACAGGGGRVDYGCLQRFDEFWTSDNTDVLDRLPIQEGFSLLFPVKCMRAWITCEGKYSLTFKAHASMCGALGIGLNLTDLSDAELETLKTHIAEYKRVRDVVQFGALYRLQSPGAGDPIQAVQYTLGGKSVLFAFLAHGKYFRSSFPVRLRGLCADALYTFTLGDEARTLSGAYLMRQGLRLPLRDNHDSLMLEFHEGK